MPEAQDPTNEFLNTLDTVQTAENRDENPEHEKEMTQKEVETRVKELGEAAAESAQGIAGQGEAQGKGNPEKSSIQGAMENALNSALASGAASSSYLKTYPINEGMRLRLINEFVYHPPLLNQIPRYKALRAMAQTFAVMVVELTPQSRERSLALTKIREAVMHANAAIALNEKEEEVSEKAE